MPPGIQVIVTELEGPVFADSRGRTLYKWPIASLRNGYAGDPKGKSACEDVVTTKTGGYMSPYPGGLDLPDQDRRKSCVALWPPVLADAKAKPVGDWSIIKRSDGVPLFIEELTKAVVEAQASRHDGVDASTATSRSALTVPASLHASL
jgi:predicted lipoprotein with Yx(FWY)xxD motif